MTCWKENESNGSISSYTLRQRTFGRWPGWWGEGKEERKGGVGGVSGSNVILRGRVRRISVSEGKFKSENGEKLSNTV